MAKFIRYKKRYNKPKKGIKGWIDGLFPKDK